MGRAVSVEGGYRLHGSWDWVSGIDHAEWLLVAGEVMKIHASSHTPETTSGVRQQRIFLVPRQEVTIRDTWFATGLRGSGSKSVVIEEYVVPENLSVSLFDVLYTQAPGSTLNPGALYQIPLMMGLPVALVASLLGATEGASAFWRQMRQQQRSYAVSSALSQQTSCTVQDALLAETEVQLDCAMLLFERCLAQLVQKRRSMEYSQEVRLRTQRDYSYIATLCRSIVERLYNASSARVQYESHPLQQY